MAITANSSADGQELTIYVEGRFDFGAHQEFRDAYERIDSSPRRYVVDLKSTTYLDSSALGMLLLLREKLAAVRKEAELTGVTGAVKQVFDIANFARLFRIS